MKNETIKLFNELLGLSGCFWLLLIIYTSFRIRKFIVSRYEDETDLLKSIYFREHATFTRHLPDFFSSALYTSHLTTFIWGWNYFKKRKAYQDIDDAQRVLRHFSRQEIRRVKWYATNGVILFIHGIAYLVFRSVWPEVFG